MKKIYSLHLTFEHNYLLFKDYLMSAILKITEFLSRHLSTIIALCALFLTIYQSYLQRKHNRLSVKPRLSTTTEFTYTDNMLIYKAHLINCGLGPAVIKSFNIVHGEKVIPVHHYQDFFDMLETLFVGQIHPDSRLFVFRKEGALGLGENECIANLLIRETPEMPISKIQTLLLEYGLYIEYESAYAEKFTYDSRVHVQ